MYVYLLKRQKIWSLYTPTKLSIPTICPSRYCAFGVPLRDMIDGCHGMMRAMSIPLPKEENINAKTDSDALCRRNSILPTCVLEINYINIWW